VEILELSFLPFFFFFFFVFIVIFIFLFQTVFFVEKQVDYNNFNKISLNTKLHFGLRKKTLFFITIWSMGSHNKPNYPPPIILFDKSGFNYKIWWLLLLLLTVTQICKKQLIFSIDNVNNPPTMQNEWKKWKNKKYA